MNISIKIERYNHRFMFKKIIQKIPYIIFCKTKLFHTYIINKMMNFII